MANYSPDNDYLALIARFPLRSLRTQADVRAAYRALRPLEIIDEDRLSPGQAEYLHALTDLIWTYEQMNHPIALSVGDHADGIDVLAELLGEKGMNASDLGRLLGNRSLGNAILSRQRQLSKAHIVRLSAHFGVSTDLLLRQRRKQLAPAA